MTIRWPKSRGKQATIAFVAALLAVVCVFLQIAMQSFNNFYFPPHKAYPYPYPSVHSAQMALYGKCGTTLLVVFATIYAVQRILTAERHPRTQ